jgi:hypothetical protein
MIKPASIPRLEIATNGRDGVATTSGYYRVTIDCRCASLGSMRATAVNSTDDSSGDLESQTRRPDLASDAPNVWL